MGKGLALEFRYRYPDMFEEYAEQCANNKIKVGQLTLWNKARPWIINFPTKDDWKYPSKMEYIIEGLKFFVEHYKLWGIKSVAFPRLGSNYGGLNWLEVKQAMYDYLKDLDLTIEIYEFDSTYQDKLFISLMSKLKEMTLQEYVDIIGLKSKEAKILKENFDNKSVASFADIQNMQEFGEKSILKIYSFANNKSISPQKKLI